MKTKYLYIVSALALGLVGCSQEYENVEAPLSSTMMQTMEVQPSTELCHTICRTHSDTMITRATSMQSIPRSEASASGTVVKATMPSREYLNNFQP